MLAHAIKELPQNLRDVVELNYYEDLNQREIADRLGISQMQVSRRLKKHCLKFIILFAKKHHLKANRHGI